MKETILHLVQGFFKQENVELILNNSEKFDESLPDDVAIARLLKALRFHHQI